MRSLPAAMIMCMPHPAVHRIVQVMNIRNVLAAAMVAVASGCSLAATPPDVTWTAYGGNFGGGRYSDLHDIGPGNVARLEVAWTYHTGDARRRTHRVAAGSCSAPWMRACSPSTR
jgi:glucose dehydrogenase